jgi:hypothetical protein
MESFVKKMLFVIARILSSWIRTFRCRRAEVWKFEPDIFRALRYGPQHKDAVTVDPGQMGSPAIRCGTLCRSTCVPSSANPTTATPKTALTRGRSSSPRNLAGATWKHIMTCPLEFMTVYIAPQKKSVRFQRTLDHRLRSAPGFCNTTLLAFNTSVGPFQCEVQFVITHGIGTYRKVSEAGHPVHTCTKSRPCIQFRPPASGERDHFQSILQSPKNKTRIFSAYFMLLLMRNISLNNGRANPPPMPAVIICEVKQNGIITPYETSAILLSIV